jgi:tyrosine-protein kinase Etk/Wzc
MSVASQSHRPSLRGQFIDADFDIPALGAALWRNKWKILRPTILIALATLAVVMVIPPKYLSESRVLVVGRDNIYLRPDADKDILDRGVVDPEAVTSQVQLILSRDLASEVIDKLKLGERREFDPALGGVSPVKRVLGIFGLIKNPMSMTPQERMLEAYYDRLSVYAVDKSRVIVIDFLSENPELAARVANAVADAYLERQQAAKQEQARSAGQWLAGEIESMRNKVAEAEAKVEVFRAKSNLLVGPNNTTLSAQQLGDLNAQLATARAQKADAEARSRLIRRMLQSGEPIESSDILNSELIRRLSEQRVTLRAQLAEQSSSLLDNHPRIKELKAQIADLDKQIRKEAETMARSLENDSKLADARVDSQLATFDLLKGQAATTNEQDIQLRALERDAKSQRDLLESYLAKYREASARDTINSAPPDARVISRATVSNVPAYPKKLPTVLIASLATLVLMSGMVLTRELLAGPASAATRMPGRAAGKALAGRTPAPVRAPEAPAAAGATTAAPPGRRRAGRGSFTDRIAAVIRRPQLPGIPISALEEFADNLRRESEDGTQVAVLGVAPGMDTTGAAITFTRALADEARVVLVGLGAGDAEIKAISGDPSAAGLAELAHGAASFADIITNDKYSALHLIVSGREPADRGALLSVPGMAKNFGALATAYGHVVIDGGAIGSPDFRQEMAALSEMAPHALLLVETLSSAATADAHDRLLEAGFGHVTIIVAGRASRAPYKSAAAA